MKKLLVLISLLFICVFQAEDILAQTYTEKTAESIVDDIIKPASNDKLNIECSGEDCNLVKGIEEAKGLTHGVEEDMTFSEFIQDKVVYVLGFLSILATIYIIYAGFVILTGVGNEEKAKSAKNTIIYVVVGMIIIWSAYSITLFIIDGLNSTNTGGGGIDGGATIVDMTS